MDLADAALAALAEDRDLRAIFTLGQRFRSHRLRTRRYLQVLPV